jgi:hypothetical protein
VQKVSQSAGVTPVGLDPVPVESTVVVDEDGTT